MKKSNLLFMTLAAVLVITTMNSCQSTKSATATKMMKFNFENGKGYDYEMITNMDQEIMGQKMKMDMTAYYSMNVTDDDGQVKTIISTIDRFKMKMGVAGFNIDVDTDKPSPNLDNYLPGKESSEENNDPMKMANIMLWAIKGQKFTMKVDAEGKVQEVTGFENMSKKIVDSMNLDEAKSKQMMKEFSKQFNGDRMKSQLERIWYIFLNKEVKVGDSWKKNSKVTGEMGGDYASTYKVMDIEGDMVTLEENTKVESDEDGVKLKGNIKGTIVVDSRFGLVVNVDQNIKMTTEVAGMSFDIKAKTKIKGKAR